MSDFVVLLGLIFVLGTIWVQIAFRGCFVCFKLCVISGNLAIFILFKAILRRRSLYPAELYPHIGVFKWFGKNADALCDVLTGLIETPCEIELIGFDKEETPYNKKNY